MGRGEGDDEEAAFLPSQQRGGARRRHQRSAPAAAPTSLAAQAEAANVHETWLWHKTEALFWLASCVGMIWYGDGNQNLPGLLLTDARVDRPWLAASIAAAAINACIYVYVVVGGHAMEADQAEGDRMANPIPSAPLAAPAGAVLGIGALFAFTVAIWPVWGVLSPGITLVLFMGFMHTAHFWPERKA